jgi:hypothetical protein
MNVWLCPIKTQSWHIIKKRKIFGAPTQVSRTMQQLRPDDLLVFHVLKPVNGVVAVAKVISNVYKDYEDVWGKARYPLRVKLEFVQQLCRDESNPISIGSFLGRIRDGEIKIEPYLKNVWISKLSEGQYGRLAKLLASGKPKINQTKRRK